jgi:hypothetical protein
MSFSPPVASLNMNVGDSETLTLTVANATSPGTLSIANRTTGIISGSASGPAQNGTLWTYTGTITALAVGSTVLDCSAGGTLLASVGVSVQYPPSTAPTLVLGAVTGP